MVLTISCPRKNFKIEGRNRDARYVDAVVRVYRKALDKKLTKKEIVTGLSVLKKIYHKGFSSGFYLRMPTSDDFAKTEHSAATEKKHFVGKIIHYYDKVKVASIKLVSDLKVGDKIVVIGKTTGIVNLKIDSIEKNKKQIKKAGKPEEIAVKILEKVRKNDEVYILKSKAK